MSRFDLVDLERRFDAEATSLISLIESHIGAGTEEERALSEYCVVALQDSWSRFVRDLVLRSSAGNAKKAGGLKVQPGPHGRLRHSAALGVLRAKWGATPKGNTWEPSWYDPGQAAKAIGILKLSNGSDVVAALGSNTNPIDDLRPIRNFSAHRLPNTSRAADSVAKKVGLKHWRQPRDVIQTNVGSGSLNLTLFEQICIRFSAVAKAAVK